LTPNDDLNNFNEDQCLIEAFEGETFPFLNDSIQHYLKIEEEQNIWVNPLNIQTPNSIVLMNFISPQVLNKNQAMPPQTSSKPIATSSIVEVGHGGHFI
jgi:hypothetical protein